MNRRQGKHVNHYTNDVVLYVKNVVMAIQDVFCNIYLVSFKCQEKHMLKYVYIPVQLWQSLSD